ncbi:hypothetical protein [Curtobacterium aurantiacum]|uniref:hypothetical protein n=1 Tax=Curtobacterium aurantiacum TaxID=3236919 RepID=UPI001BE05259|nr:hypothetical protein [Curtobacterium flaccumfaciens]
MRQIRRRTTQHLDFLLEETVALTQLADLSISTTKQRRTGVNGCLLGARAGSHFVSVIRWTPKSPAMRLIDTLGSRFSATRTTSSRNSFG